MTRSKPQGIALRDARGRTRTALQSNAPSLASRFVQFQQAVITHHPDSVPAPLSAYLIAFDGIADAVSLREALAGVGRITAWRDTVLIDWTPASQWMDRRALSVLTQLRLADYKLASIASEIHELAAFARQTIPRWEHLCDRDVLEHLFEAAWAWTSLNLPGMLGAHVLGIQRFQMLPRSALARDATGQALAQIEVDAAPSPDELQLLDSVATQARSDDLTVIEAIARAAGSIREARNYASARSRLLNALHDLAPQAQRHGWMQSLLLAWAIDLVRNGTALREKLAPSTLANYLTIPLRALAAELQRLEALPMSGEAWMQRYEQAMESVSAGQRRNTRSAISLFHRFLVDTLDAPALTHRLEIEDVPPAASIIWPHEFTRILAWLDTGQGDRRLLGALATIFELARAARLRASEVLSLRLRNVIDVPSEIEYAPLQRDRPGKSDSARRTAMIDERARGRLDAWIAQRRSDGADDLDLLFGDPHAPDQIYRRGLTLWAMRQLPKAATGDPDANFHSLSHAFANAAFNGEIALPSGPNLNPPDQIAAAMGHFSAVSLRDYLHLIERPLRHALDEAIERSVNVSARQAGTMTATDPATLRQRAHREGRRHGVRHGYYKAVAEHAPLRPWPCVADAHELDEPVAPSWLTTPAEKNISIALQILCDIAEGRSIELAAQRAVCHVRVVRAILRRALDTLKLIEAWRPTLRIRTTPDEALAREFAQWVNSPAGLVLRRAYNAQFAAVRRNPPTKESPGWCAWAESYENGHIALRERDISDLSSWLQQIGVSPLHLAISVESAQRDAGERIATACRLIFGTQLRIFEHSGHAGARPVVYLIWSSQRIARERPPPASCALDGLHAWMLAAACVADQDTDDNSMGEDQAA